MGRFPWLILIGLLAADTVGLSRVSAAQQSPQSAAITPIPSHPSSDQKALLDQYCVTCHNSRLKTGGLTLDNIDVSRPASGVAVWEKVIRKVGTDQMPPPGRPRPDKQHKDALVSWLVSEIDRDAAAH